MVDKQLAKTLELMLNQMTEKQKNKLAGLLKDEAGLKRALSGIDMKKARQIAGDLHIDGAESMDIEKLINAAKNNPQLARELERIL